MVAREIFVFGSNRAGRHGKGAARYAFENYGARHGIGEGLTGDAYALPTKGCNLERLPFTEIDAAICRFIQFARNNPNLTFILTPIGTGLAGYSKRAIWSVLRREGLPSNVRLSSSWVND